MLLMFCLEIQVTKVPGVLLFTDVPSTSTSTTTMELDHETGLVSLIPFSDTRLQVPSTASMCTTSSKLKGKKSHKRMRLLSKADCLDRQAPADDEERILFKEYLQSEIKKNTAKTEFMKEQSIYFKTRNRREELEIEKLKSELGTNPSQSSQPFSNSTL